MLVEAYEIKYTHSGEMRSYTPPLLVARLEMALFVYDIMTKPTNPMSAMGLTLWYGEQQVDVEATRAHNAVAAGST